MPNDPPSTYDLEVTCPLARWRELAPNHLAYGIEGLEPCAVISDGDKDKTAFAWNYHVQCFVHGRLYSSRKDTRAACLEEASIWLEKVIHCPGHARQHPPDNGT
jgi:hypothetical protein